jgi:hypothetical protein
MKKGDIVDIFTTTENNKCELNEIATGGNQTSGPNQITEKIRREAVKLAESPQGLDIAAFQRKHNISVMNIDELIKGQ